MIHRIFSDLPTFKALEFRPGLNILLAEMSPGATELQTRNGAGKTSFIELVHFLLGGKAERDSLFRKTALAAFTFGMEFDLAEFPTIVKRSGSRPSRILFEAAFPDNWPEKPNSVDENTSDWVLSNEKWKRVLGKLILEIPTDTEKFGPTFRSLFSYFVRRQSNEGFLSPITQSRWQYTWDQQVAISYLLGLDWTISSEWEAVRKKERTLQELRKAASGEEEVFGSIIGKSADLRTQLIVAEDRVRQLRETISNFRVLPQYRELEKEASDLAIAIGTLADENTIDRQLLSELESAIASESAPDFRELENLFAEAGIVLPQAVVRRFDEVQRFHMSVIQNRRNYLERETHDARRRIEEREREIEKLDARKAAIMSTLNSHGALEQYSQLRTELSRLEAELETIRQRYAAAEQLEGLATELAVERNQLLQRLRLNFREQDDTLRKAIRTFQEISQALYEEAGSLTIDASENGPKFEIKIHGELSKGISNMQIFCFDMMLMQMCIERGIGPGFLIHDSHLFDGVDERQIAKALQLGAEISESLDFQYIVTMNSDVLPSLRLDDFDPHAYVLDTVLTDAEQGGLFGIRFS